MSRWRWVVGLAAGAALLGGLPAPEADAASGAVRSCRIVNGGVFHCGPWHQGSAVLHRDGAFRSCKVRNGRTFSCGPWFQGEAVAYHNKAYRSCRIVNGRIMSCGPWFQGAAVIDRPR